MGMLETGARLLRRAISFFALKQRAQSEAAVPEIVESDNPDYACRIRFSIPALSKIGIDAACAEIPLDGPREVVLASADHDKPIRKASWLVLRSDGWDTPASAEAAAERIMDCLRRTQARHHLGADLGRRSPGGGFSKAGLQMMSDAFGGGKVLNDAHGLMVFDARMNPRFAGIGSVTAYVTVQGERWIATFQKAFDSAQPLTEAERTAFDLYTAAHASSGDAMFVLCFAAFETLLEDVRRPVPVLQFVDRIIELARECDFSDELGAKASAKERERLLGSLRHLRSRSIRHAGIALVQGRLQNMTYANLSPADFFEKCYDLRNRFVHGATDFPPRDEVIRVAGHFSQLVGDLLAGPLLGFEPMDARTNG